jgi:hypothetical protein
MRLVDDEVGCNRHPAAIPSSFPARSPRTRSRQRALRFLRHARSRVRFRSRFERASRRRRRVRMDEPELIECVMCANDQLLKWPSRASTSPEGYRKSRFIAALFATMGYMRLCMLRPARSAVSRKQDRNATFPSRFASRRSVIWACDAQHPYGCQSRRRGTGPVDARAVRSRGCDCGEHSWQLS